MSMLLPQQERTKRSFHSGVSTPFDDFAATKSELLSVANTLLFLFWWIIFRMDTDESILPRFWG